MIFGAALSTLSELIKNFVPAKRKIREEVKAQGEGQLAVGEKSLSYWQERLGWSPQAAKYLATAFTFGVRENVAAILEKAQELSDSDSFEAEFAKRVQRDPSVLGTTLEAAKFTTAEEIRDLLARILANDVANPGSVSRRTVTVAQDLSTQDLREFLKLRPATWEFEQPDADACLLVLGPRITQYGEQFLSFDTDKIGVDYYAFGEFLQLGLLQERLDGLALGMAMHDADSKIRLRNGSHIVSMRATTSETKIQLGVYAFTKTGSEIISLFLNEEVTEIEGYFEEACKYWSNAGVEITELPTIGDRTC